GLGLQKIAKYYYFPGWHQPTSWDSIIVNMDVWKSLTGQQQRAMTEACYANITAVNAEQIGAQIDAIEAIEKAGVEVRRFPDPVLKAMRDTATQVMQDEAAKDPLFKEAYESLTAYMQRVGRWSQLQDLSLKD